MIEKKSKTKMLSAKMVIVLLLAFVAPGMAMHGLSVSVVDRIWQNLLGRPRGEITFRFIDHDFIDHDVQREMQATAQRRQ